MSQSAQSTGKACCRLCLAPESECVDIFKTQAADKQPIQAKINICVQIQVNEADRLSVRICHACISFLNSWQSFKNRCDAAQRKQKIWLSSGDGKSVSTSTGQSLLKTQLNGHENQLKPAIETAQQKFQETQVELQRQKLKQLVQQQQANHQVDTSFIKSEPASDDEDVENVMELDPSQFLAPGSSEDESDIEDDRVESVQNGNGPSILTSLGLTHINSISQNPFASFANSDDSANDDKGSEVSSSGLRNAQVPTNCSVCNMQFSNRANARRHEKNIHNVKPTPIGPQIKQQAPEKPVIVMTTPTPVRKSKANSAMHIDYTKPELYRHLLTASKLQFILSNLNFLEQAQNMKCKCCDKQFPSYKFFMGHMRKKYHGLPRNVCFKCLKQFDSKGQFIGHLKRPGDSCPNLYRLVMADDNIPKNLMKIDTNLRTPAKDVLANRVYACAICDDTFRLKTDFREHVYRTHMDVTKNRETPNASCINCNESFQDSAVRRRHFNNLDCIVYIVCNTCGEQFPSQAVYLEHVYQTHLKSKDGANGVDDILFEEPPEESMQNNLLSTPGPTKNVQKCPVCQKPYNNYYNVLRHMEAKHPDQVPQVYQCPECPEEKFSKQTYLRDHLVKVHNKVEVSPKHLSQHQIGSQKLPAYVCKFEDCGIEFREKAKWMDHQVSEHEGQIRCMFCEHIDDDRDSFEKHLETIHQYQMAHESEDENNTTPLNSEQTKSFKCRICTKRIATKTGLQKHMIKVHHVGGELVKCTLCPADFANDKGLKVHLWRCHEIREADYTNVLPPDLLDPYTQQQRKIKQEEEQKSILLANESGKDMKKSYECPLCQSVCSSRDDLADHQKSVHALDDVDIFESDDPFASMLQDDSEMNPTVTHVTGDDELRTAAVEEEYWFQCRFCQRCFNSSKKLTIHMNSHQEGGSALNGPDEHGGYPCKECNIVYKSKKSLWVHRHKKHPRIPDPSPCESCEKTFFDQAELSMHIQHVHPTGIPAVGDNSTSDAEPSDSFHWLLDTSGNNLSSKADSSETSAIVSGPKKRKRPAPSETPDGQFACDMCPKAFSNANALQVHRGWHFRSPDGRKVTNPNEMWMPNQVPPSKVRRTTPIQSVTPQNMTCHHCETVFSNPINLRRHIIEVHEKKTNDEEESNYESSDEVKMDRVGECRNCNVSFATIAEWIEHKINDAKVKKSTINPSSSSASYECEICVRAFSRRERLLQHMLSHLNDRKMDPEVIKIHQLKQTSKNGDTASHHQLSEDENEPSDEEEDDDDEEIEVKPPTFSCELCSVHFASSQELRAHVADHFLNGGAITPTVNKQGPVVESDVELELDEIELEEAQVDYQQPMTSQDEDESSSEEESSTTPEENVARPPLPKIQVQVHRCRVCNAAFLESSRSVECMMSHQKPSNHKCSECQLYFSGSKNFQDHEKLCHS